MASPLDAFLLPERVVARALADLRSLGEIARLAPRAIRLLESLDAKAARMLDIAERLDAKATAVLDVGERIEHEAQIVQRRAEQINATALELLKAMPTFEQAVGLVAPLEGAVERLGRVADRLPGGRRRTTKPPTA
jgi:chloramphenicol 3-O-phosphotransferase